MKRSEMLQILLGSIYENISCYEGLGLDTSNYNKILDDLEAAGMVPPLVGDKNVETSVIVAMPMGWTEMRTENSTVFSSRWEEETES